MGPETSESPLAIQTPRRLQFVGLRGGFCTRAVALQQSLSADDVREALTVGGNTVANRIYVGSHGEPDPGCRVRLGAPVDLARR
jgi:hypothetical protein